jgi:prevent-host-death family protein
VYTKFVTVKVGVRELRENLRAYLERAKNGDVVVVTERGKPIARLSSTEEDAAWERLVAEGLITPPKRAREPIDFKGLPRLGHPTLTDILLEQRRSSKY